MSWWKWLLVLAVHFYALYAPGSGEPGIFDVLPAGTDKVVHVALFAVPTFLARVSIRRWWPVILLAVHATEEAVAAMVATYAERTAGLPMTERITYDLDMEV